VILALSRGQYYGLNRVGLFLRRLLQEPRQVREICDSVVATYRVDRERAEMDVLEIVTRLADESLVQSQTAH
jgi:hypothetical protein